MMSILKCLYIGMLLVFIWFSGDVWWCFDSNIEGIFGSDFVVDIVRCFEVVYFDFVFCLDVSSLLLDVLEIGFGFVSLDFIVLFVVVVCEILWIGLVLMVFIMFYLFYVVVWQL